MSDAISSARTRNYLHQIKGAVAYRAIGVAASFLAIPLMIGYLGPAKFGVWSTLLTVISWVVFFDLGIGNGLRNKVAELLAKNENGEARRYIASGYALIGMISVALCIIATVGTYFVRWQQVFNTQLVSESSLRGSVQIASFFVILNFWIGLIAALLGAVQKTSLIALGQMLSNLMVLAMVFSLTKTTNASISSLAFAYGVSLVASNLMLSYWFYCRYTDLRAVPKLAKEHTRTLLNIGLQFFIIQLAALVMFTTDKILITQMFGPESVTQYDVVYKLFSIVTFAHAMVSAPLWSAYTDAYQRGDLDWIRKMLGKQLKIYLGVVVGVCLLALLAKTILTMWVGPQILVEGGLIVAMGIFIAISIWSNIFAMLVNGIGKIKPQLYTAVIAMLINIPLSVMLAKYTPLGLSGIVVGTTCSLLFASIVLPLQVKRLLKGV